MAGLRGSRLADGLRAVHAHCSALHEALKPTRNITGGTLQIRFLDGDKRLPIMRLHRAA